MARPKPLPVSKLYHRCPTGQFKFRTTDDLKNLDLPLGQQRAVDAIEFGIDMRRKGYNLFAMGPSGSGKHAIVRRFLDAKARKANGGGVFDWCYVNNFDDARQPTILRLPSGTGKKFAARMDQLVEDIVVAIPMMFESDEYRARLREIHEELARREEKPFEALRARARKRNIAIVRTPSGLAMSPMQKGEIIQPDAFEQLSDEEKIKITEAVGEVQKDLQQFAQEAPKWKRASQQQVRELNREISRILAHGLIEEVRQEYAELEGVQRYLSSVENHVVENADTFRRRTSESEESPIPGMPGSENVEALISRYRVNVLIDNGKLKGAPVVYEDNPTYENLVGAIEHVADQGTLVTDFTLIKPGALHRANGGFLILDAAEVIANPSSWDGLKRALQADVIRTQPLGKHLSLLSTVTLEPEPVPIDLKVVLVGERRLFYLLQRYDPDFDELFKVAVDFEEDISRETKSLLLYARMVATTARREKLLPFNKKGVARIVEYGSRLADDSEKLSVHMIGLADLMREASYLASKENRRVVSDIHIDAALAAQNYRVSRVPERMREGIQSGIVLIETTGEKVGQINALSVYQVGNHAFGQPNRISARVRKGHGHVIDIEREVKLGGALHSKGVLILSSYLASTYLPMQSLSLSASLVFEQSYGGVDGDSASSTELYALLSAISGVPLKQCFAVTGSVSQFGQVQAIGGVNEKIEGFFDICAGRGLTGDQGVLIPESNVRHLMLKKEVRDAVRQGKFSIYPVTTIDEGIEILTGVAAGSRNAKGEYPAKSINGKVEARLKQYARSKDKDDKDKDKDENEDGEDDD